MCNNINAQGFPRTMYPCPQCGKPRRHKIGVCKDCRLEKVRQSAVGPAGWKRTKYRCATCGAATTAKATDCRSCYKQKAIASKAVRHCPGCGVELKSRKSKHCTLCSIKERIGRGYNRKPSHGGKCTRCEAAIKENNIAGLCPKCNSMTQKARIELEKREGPLDPEVYDAAKTKRVPTVKRCGGCGGKYLTKKCLKCVIVKRVGEKGIA